MRRTDVRGFRHGSELPTVERPKARDRRTANLPGQTVPGNGLRDALGIAPELEPVPVQIAEPVPAPRPASKPGYWKGARCEPCEGCRILFVPGPALRVHRGSGMFLCKSCATKIAAES